MPGASAGLTAILIMFPIYLLYVGKLQTYFNFASAKGNTDNGLSSNVSSF